MKNYSLITLLIVFTSANVRAEDTSPSTIPLVQTWEDLRAAPVVATGPFGSARLGLEGLEAPKWGGVLVYCLVQPDDESQLPHRFDHDEVLGPLDCRITRQGSPTILQSNLVAAAGKRSIGLREVLYTRAVIIDQPGEYVVQISQRDQQELVAKVVVVGKDQSFHAWTPMSRSKRIANPQAATDRDEFVSRLSTRPRGIALPTHDGMQPIDWLAENQEHQQKRPLPKLSPTNVSDELTLKGNSEQLIIESDQKMIVARPDWHFLARWWVNGEPFLPKQLSEYAADENGMITSGHRIVIQFDFDPADVGAQSGDKIGLQLLHLPGGWRVVDDSLAHLSSLHDGPNLPRLTNRIEFPAP